MKIRHIIKNVIAYIIIPAVIGFFQIYKVFFMHEFAFEPNDEVAHTFVEIPLFWKILTSGNIPFINLYNNFGTPLIGDPVINPLAPHALSYLIFHGPLAATVNKFVIIMLTVSLLTYFYSKYLSLTLLLSCISAAILVITPHIHYFFAHHPHQGVVLYFTTVVIMQKQLKRHPSLLNVFGLYVSIILFMLGVGTNGFLFGVPFLLVHQFMISNAKVDKCFATFFVLLLAVFIFAYPHFASFFRWASLSARKSLDFTALTAFSYRKLIADVCFYFNGTGPLLHVSWTIYYSIPVVIAGFAGCVYMFKDNQKALSFQVLVLGVVPLVGVLVLLGAPEVRRAIWLLRPVDVSRLLWFANIFFVAGIGYFLDRIRSGKVSKIGICIVAFVCMSSIYTILVNDYMWTFTPLK